MLRALKFLTFSLKHCLSFKTLQNIADKTSRMSGGDSYIVYRSIRLGNLLFKRLHFKIKNYLLN